MRMVSSQGPPAHPCPLPVPPEFSVTLSFLCLGRKTPEARDLFTILCFASNQLSGPLSSFHPLQCSCLENPRDRVACWAAVCGVTRSRTRLKQFSSGGSSSCLPSQSLFFSPPCPFLPCHLSLFRLPCFLPKLLLSWSSYFNS